MFSIAQDQRYVGKDWWDWKVWIEGDDRALDNITEVVWHLHPTFSPPDVRTTNRSDKFLLHRSGWGTFEIVADLKLLNGSPQKLKHELELCYPDREEDAPRR